MIKAIVYKISIAFMVIKVPFVTVITYFAWFVASLVLIGYPIWEGWFTKKYFSRHTDKIFLKLILEKKSVEVFIIVYTTLFIVVCLGIELAMSIDLSNLVEYQNQPATLKQDPCSHYPEINNAMDQCSVESRLKSPEKESWDWWSIGVNSLIVLTGMCLIIFSEG